MRTWRLTRYLLAAAAVASCAAAIDTQPPPTSIRRVLFVGNSLTYVNDLPATVAALARDNGDTLHVTMSAGADMALIDHLTGGSNATQMLRDSSWDAVVLQQGPTSRPGICRDSMILWTGMFAPLIQHAGGVSMTLMSWPAISQGDVWDGVHTSASMAAASVHGVLVPAGDAWHIALLAHPGLPLYGPDGYHPSPMGTFLAALTVYQRISNRDPRSLAPHAFTANLPMPMRADTLAWLADAAYAATAASAAPPIAPTKPSERIPGTTSSGC